MGFYGALLTATGGVDCCATYPDAGVQRSNLVMHVPKTRLVRLFLFFLWRPSACSLPFFFPLELNSECVV